MATKKVPDVYKNLNGYPQSMSISRTRSALPSSVSKSSSAMSSRTYSRIKGGTSRKSDEVEVRRSMNFEDNDSSHLDESMVDMEELENEQELLKRMIDQQKQLQELRERQKHVLQLQQQLASMEASAELSMEEKLAKVKAAKTRLDELQKLVTTIKSVETAKSGEGDSPYRIHPDKALQVKKALEELDELKSLIGAVSGNTATERPQQKPAATMEPVFPNFVARVDKQDRARSDYQPVLPEVSVVRYDDDARVSSHYGLQSPRKSAKRKSKDSGRLARSPLVLSPYQSKQKKVKKGKTVRTKSPEKESEITESERLLEEMRRHQVLLQELRERRQELEELMNTTRETQVEVEEEDDGDDYNDANASIRSNLGSLDDGRGMSDTEAADFETSQSGRMFGLNEADTRRLIDLIRNQKGLGAATEKTTATWGSSSSDDLSESENAEVSRIDENDESELQVSARTKFPKSSGNDRQDFSMGTTVRDAFTQLNYKEEHEIDFRPPTRRRRNITQPEADKSITVDLDPSWSDLSKLQNNLLASNNTMHILLEDQHALTKLLMNTLNLRQNALSSDLCYGISPDFLIYQLDNCSAQFAATLNETKDLQWQLYSLTKANEGGDKPALSTRSQEAPASYVPTRKPQVMYKSRGDVENFSRGAKVRSSVDQTALSLQQASGEKYTPVQKEEAGDAGSELFEAMRDSIYSEAAILISQNEARPHFLIELFHTLQQLNTDYLRQHALYTLQDVIKGYIPASPGKDRGSPNSKGAKGRIVKRGSYSENTPSESAATSEDEVYTKLRAKDPENCGYDFSLKVSSASDLSTPSEEEVTPFAADDLGSTVIHLDAALRHMREMERFKQEIQNSGGLAQSSQKSAKRMEVAQVDTEFLRVWIKNIVAEIIPILKANHDKTIDKKLGKLMQGKVLEFVSEGMTNTQGMPNGPEGGASGETDDTDTLNMENFFSGQLKSILDDCFAKFVGQKVGACGEDMIVALSEILFNELAFFYMMQDLGKEKKSAKKPGSIPSIKIEQEEEDTKDRAEVNSAVSGNGEENQEDDSELSATEDNVCGLNGEDAQDSNFKQSCELSPHPVTVDLSVSETKPLTSYGSGEDEEDGSGDEFDYKEPDVPTSMQHDADAEQEKNKAQERSEVQEDKKESKPQENEEEDQASEEKTEESI